MNFLGETHTELDVLINSITPVHRGFYTRALQRFDTLAKPPGSLGRIEQLGAQLAAIEGRLPPRAPRNPILIVMAGDHGVVAQGVTAAKSDSTGRVVENILAGRSGANAFARATGARVVVLDVGITRTLPKHPHLITRKIRRGTADLSAGPSMSTDEAKQAILVGASTALEWIDGGSDLLLLGEVGVGNTMPAIALLATALNVPAHEAADIGFGTSDPVGRRRVELVDKAVQVYAENMHDPGALLAAIGGLEIASIVGAILAGASRRVPIVLDGLITLSAAVIAVLVQPQAKGYLVASHLSPEAVSKRALEWLGLPPLLDLSLRLGEGTGALLAVPIVNAAARSLGEMATAKEIGLHE